MEDQRVVITTATTNAAANATTADESEACNDGGEELARERQTLLLMLLGQVCSLHDATPRTFVVHVIALYERGILEQSSIRLLFDIGLIPSSWSRKPTTASILEIVGPPPQQQQQQQRQRQCEIRVNDDKEFHDARQGQRRGQDVTSSIDHQLLNRSDKKSNTTTSGVNDEGAIVPYYDSNNSQQEQQNSILVSRGGGDLTQQQQQQQQQQHLSPRSELLYRQK